MGYSNFTANYNLGLFMGGDTIEYQDWNANVEKIDAELKKSSGNVGALQEFQGETASQLASITTNQNEMNTKIETLQTNVNEGARNIIEIQSAVAENSVDIENLQDKVQMNTDDINALEGGTNYRALVNRVDTAEGNINILNHGQVSKTIYPGGTYAPRFISVGNEKILFIPSNAFTKSDASWIYGLPIMIEAVIQYNDSDGNFSAFIQHNNTFRTYANCPVDDGRLYISICGVCSEETVNNTLGLAIHFPATLLTNQINNPIIIWQMAQIRRELKTV